MGTMAILLAMLAPRAMAAVGIVHLFEWRFDDIAQECENFLGPRGFEAVQVSPVNEYAVIGGRPWWERYQPFSYKIASRSGDENEFRQMCERCRKAGVKIYVDIVINHMTGNQPAGTKGTAGSDATTTDKYYPAVPYSKENFHATCTVDNFNDVNNVRNCELVGLHDLDQSQQYVRQKIIDFLNHLIDLGAAGFRVDAAKHIWPADLQAIYSQVKNTVYDQQRPFIYQEVSDFGGEAVKREEYFPLGHVTEFRNGRELSRCFSGQNALKWLKNFGTPWGLMAPEYAIVFVDNHDTQRSDSSVLTYKRSKNYKMAVAFMLSWGFGTPRVMSSFFFDSSDQGPPHNDDMTIKRVGINPDNTCYNGWVCEHRWSQIYGMVEFANVAKGTQMSNFWDNGNNQISFCKGNKGFIAFNLENYDMNVRLQTCLPSGTYCDIATGFKLNNSCTGKSVTVSYDGTAQIFIGSNAPDGFLAIHQNSKI
ncbi:alpha-amylase [Nesidiocoris tenuis]|uniref:Alpha-amylase n=2 Tax=Nesidiocoris tenuis TaxID=355587 RepID=A0ABN7B8M8_9HEMI|nr:alpha-amylase [Nesidiocoris tenuis]